MKTRATLPAMVQALLPVLERTYAALVEASHPNWYSHLSFEKRASENLSINPRGQNVSDSDSMGVVLRIFDGVSMFEASTDDFEEAALKQKALALVEKVKKSGVSAPAAPVYKSPSWAERIKADLVSEIREQIPAEANANTWVHFGTPQKEKLFSGTQEAMEFLKKTADRFLALKNTLPLSEPAQSPDFWQSRMGLAKLYFIFIDSSVRMTQSLLRNSIMVMATKGEDYGHYSKGGLGGLETVSFTDREFFEAYDQLAKGMRAERLTPGRYKLIMAPGITGVFAHEAFGHTQEADTWARGRSKARELYANKTRVGNEHATIINNPAVFQNGEDDFAAWGSYYFDEEGWLAGKQKLVEEGWLQLPMTNLTSAIRLNVPRTANGKRESWMNAIYSRQTNTYFTPGNSTFQELMEKVDYGFLAANCNGGMEDPKGMGIQVGMLYLEEIREGKLTGRTFKGPNGGGVQMTGYVPDYLNSILGKTKIEAFKAGPDSAVEPLNEVGGCGKYHKESVAAGCGGTYMLVDNVLLG